MCSDKLFYAIIPLHTPTQHSLVSHPSHKSKETGGIKLWIRAFPMTTLLHIKDKMIWGKWACKMRQMTIWFAVFYTMKWRKSFYVSLSTTSPPLINPQTTPSISRGNYSPLSSERGWGWGFVSLPSFCKGAVLEALSPTFLLNNYCISFHSYMVSLTRKKAFGNLLCKEYISDCWLTELTWGINFKKKSVRIGINIIAIDPR